MVTEGGGHGFATAYPCTADVPNASSLSYGTGTTRPNELITKLSPEGTLCIYTLTTTDLIIDITGHN